MSFEVLKKWEDTSPIHELFPGGENIRTFPIVKLTMNMNVFLIDIETEELHERFFMSSVSDLMNFIAQFGPAKFSVSLLSRRCDNDGQYSVADLSEIIEAKDKAGQPAHIFHCQDGKMYIDSFLAESESDLNSLKTVYFSK